MKKYLGNKAMILALIAPTMILICVMVLYPLVILFTKSFTEWDGLNPSTFKGLDNYIRLFKDPIFYTGLQNGIIFALVPDLHPDSRGHPAGLRRQGLRQI